jgi:hypothetical protein
MSSTLLLCRVGLFDGPMALTATLLAFGATSDAGAESIAAGLGDALLSLLTSNKDGPLLELSPKGVQALLEGVQQLVQVDAGGPGLLTGVSSEQQQALVTHGSYGGKVLPALLLLLSERHLGALTAWGDGRQGGGRAKVAQLVAMVADILMVPLVTSTGGCKAFRAYMAPAHVCELSLWLDVAPSFRGNASLR